MAFPGHRWQALRVTLVLVQHLRRTVGALPLTDGERSACLALLQSAYAHIESDRNREAGTAVRACIDRLQEATAAGALTSAEAEEALRAAHQLLDLLPG